MGPLRRFEPIRCVTAILLFFCASCAWRARSSGITAAPPPGQKYTLAYHHAEYPHPLLGMLPGNRLEVIVRPSDAPSLPKINAESSRFAKWPSPLVPQGFLWIAVDRPDDDERFARLLIDADGDGRLDDETSVATRFSRPPYTVFEPVEVVFHDGSTSVPYHLQFTLIEEEGPARLEARSCGWYEATIEVGGEEKLCVLVDKNANGVFNDASLDFADCDLIRIVTPGLEDVALVGRFVEVDKQIYTLKVGTMGGFVELAPASGVRFGKVRRQKEMTELVAGGENGMFTLDFENGADRLPAGKYRIYQWVVEREDEYKNIWQLKANSFGNPDVFEVSAGKTTRLTLGDPIVSAVDVFRQGADCVIRHGWQGQSGENIQLFVNGAPPPPAQVHIWNANGAYDRIFTFDHG